MNTSKNQDRPSDARLDRLVDGELSDSDRRQLLSSLDHEPGAGAVAALAFLEAQTWRDELKHLRDEPGEQPAAAPATAGHRLARHWLGVLTLAASVLVAFGLGLKLRDATVGRDASSEPPPQLADVPPGADDTLPAAATLDPNGPPNSRMVQLGFNDGGTRRQIDLPVIDSPRLDPKWVEQGTAALPAEMLRALEDSGHRVKQERQLWPVQLRDGRKLMVPVDQVELQYVGHPTY